MSSYICTICDYIGEGSSLPPTCPFCGVSSVNLKSLTKEEFSQIEKKSKHSKTFVDAMGDSVALRGYNPKGVNKQNMFA